MLKPFALAALAFVTLCQPASAKKSPLAAWQPGVHYSILVPPEDTAVPEGKVEVLELFMYTSPRSRDLQPHLEKWLKNKPDYIVFSRKPSIVFPHARLQSRLFFTLQQMGREDLHDEAFKWIFDKKHYPRYHKITHPDEKEYFHLNLEFAKANGLDEEKFTEIYNSKEIVDKVIGQEIDTHGYQVRGTSTLVVNGKYSTSLIRVVTDTSQNMRGAKADDYERLLQLTSELAAREREEWLALDAKARALQKRLLAVDSHVDVLLPSTNERYFLPDRGDRADLDKLRKGNIGVVALALAVGSGSRDAQAVKEARAEVDAKLGVIRAFLKAHPKQAGLALSVADINRLHNAGKLAVIESFLNARSLGGNVEAIDELYRDGVRLFGLVHSGHNDFADSSRPSAGQPTEEHKGLSTLGKEAIARLNRLGAIIDVSQMSKAATLQTLALSKAPVIASHSAVRGLVDKARNLSDEELDAVKANGGVVHVTAFNGYLADIPDDMPDKVRALRVKYGLSPDFPGQEFAFGEQALTDEEGSKFDDELAALYPKATVRTLVDHIDYIVKRIGVDHVGIGSDFNHGSGIEGFNDASEAPNITRELLRRGYSEADIAKIWGGNFMRVFRAVEAEAKQLRHSASAK